MRKKPKRNLDRISKDRKRSGSELIYIRNMSPDLKKAFKAKCAKRGKTMREVVLDMMHGYVTGDIK